MLTVRGEVVGNRDKMEGDDTDEDKKASPTIPSRRKMVCILISLLVLAVVVAVVAVSRIDEDSDYSNSLRWSISEDGNDTYDVPEDGNDEDGETGTLL